VQEERGRKVFDKREAVLLGDPGGKPHRGRPVIIVAEGADWVT
jgi:hypothetical protein